MGRRSDGNPLSIKAGHANLPQHLRMLARVDGEVKLKVEGKKGKNRDMPRPFFEDQVANQLWGSTRKSFWSVKPLLGLSYPGRMERVSPLFGTSSRSPGE